MTKQEVEAQFKVLDWKIYGRHSVQFLARTREKFRKGYNISDLDERVLKQLFDKQHK